MFLKSVDGEYEPSFFIIRLRTTQAINVAAEENISTFIHEYIHFLQDLILPYCIRENLVRLATFFDYMDRAHNHGEIRLPNVLPLDGADLTIRQSSMTWGSNKFVSSVGRIDDVQVTEVPVVEHGYKLYQYDLTLDDGSIYQFGARDLLEYIAWKIESKHFPGEQKLPDLPYYSVDILVRHYRGSHLSDFKRIALAEYCLLNDNPAHRLILFLEDLQAGALDGIDKGSDEAFDHFLRNAHWKSNGVRFETIPEKLDRRSDELRRALQARFPQGAFPEIYSWLDRVIKFARNALAGKNFFAELFAAETPNFFSAINHILEEVGVPLVVNDAGEMGTSLGGDREKDQFLQLLLAYEFLDYLDRDDLLCPMYQVCEREREDLMNDDCLNAPFRRALRDDLCPFGAFAKTHGLDRISWYVNDRFVSSQGSNWP
jgi:hypothetical protein